MALLIRFFAELDGVETNVVHNYGHGGFGFQASLGSARAALDLVPKQ